MSFDYIRSTVEPMLEASWSYTPYKLQEVPFKGERAAWPSEFLEFLEIKGQTSTASLGGYPARPMARYTGVLRFYINIRPNKGIQRINELMQHLIDLFAYKRLGSGSDILTYHGTPSTPTNDDGYVTAYVDVQYSRDELAT